MAASPLYVTASDIAAIIKPPVTASTVPNLNTVGSIITEISAEVEAAAAFAGYQLPIPTTATQAYAQMSGYVKTGVLWKTLRFLLPQQGGEADKNLSANEHRDSFLATLEMLRKGELPLVGAALDPSDVDRVQPRSFSTTHPGGASDVNGNTQGYPPLVQRDYVW